MKTKIPELQAHGETREHAISEYRRIYHPKKPHCAATTQLGRVLADSAKYREIIEEYRRYVAAPMSDTIESVNKTNFIFTSKLWKIIEDDYNPHCDKCHQELKQ